MKAADLVYLDGTTAKQGNTARRRPKRLPGKVAGKFLKGPIPWCWIQRAGVLGGRALHVGLVMWFEAGCCGSHQVAVNQKAIAAAFEIDRATVRRAIQQLERAGLIRLVERHRGQRAVVELIDEEPQG